MRVWQSLEIKSNPLKSQMRNLSKILTQSYLEAQESSAVVFSPPESGQQSGNSQMSHETASHDSKTIFYLKCESQEICSWKIACRFFFFLAADENFNIIFGKIRLLFYKTHLVAPLVVWSSTHICQGNWRVVAGGSVDLMQM